MGDTSKKDDRGMYLPSDPPPKDPLPSEINLVDLLDKHLLILYRETRTLLELTSQGRPLGKDYAYSMRENIKLLLELIKKEKDLLNSLSKEEIEKLLNHDKDSNGR